MTFILRAVLILLLFSFVVYVLKTLARVAFNVRKTLRDVRSLRDQMNDQMGAGQAAGRASGRSSARVSAEMVKCIRCGAFVSATEALRVSGKGKPEFYCSRECMRAG
ncbi:MAG: hypothetical protein ACKV2V_27235 [Blastocatellia bacterium]